MRALAAWMQARRELTERVEVLLMHGPTAVERVGRHLEELRAGYAREHAAFEALEALLRGEEPPEQEPAPVGAPPAYPPLRSVVLPP